MSFIRNPPHGLDGANTSGVVMLRLALVHHPSRAVAEEIVQDTWLAVIQGIDRFEGRASFKTWLFRILVNRAHTRAEREARDLTTQAISALPPGQRQVITLRDVEGWPSEHVCNVLEISETNQRVLLHRARSRVRAAAEHYFEGELS
ncbi:MAG: RNA polymerase sigma factor [Gemmatimonadales bacterium]